MENIGYISSIATVILFIIYFFGRIVSIFIVKPILSETFVYLPDKEITEKHKIIDYYDLNGFANLVITTQNGLRKIECFECNCRVEPKFKIKKTHRVILHKFLQKNHSISIKIDMAEILPAYIIEFSTFDFMRGRFIVWENGKHGILTNDIFLKHTLKSFLYYLTK
jgi:hypothetical protein